MAALHFYHGVMNSGKTIDLLKMHHNNQMNGHYTVLLSPSCDSRSGSGRIKSRIGVSQPSIAVSVDYDIVSIVQNIIDRGTKVHSVLIDEAQFFTRAQVMQMTDVVDELGIPVIAFGLRSDAFGNLFEGSQALMEFADKLKEIGVRCFCGAKAVMNMRFDEHGNRVREGKSIDVGGEEKYRSACRKHWKSINHIEECTVHKSTEEAVLV